MAEFDYKETEPLLNETEDRDDQQFNNPVYNNDELDSEENQARLNNLRGGDTQEQQEKLRDLRNGEYVFLSFQLQNQYIDNFYDSIRREGYKTSDLIQRENFRFEMDGIYYEKDGIKIKLTLDNDHTKIASVNTIYSRTKDKGIKHRSLFMREDLKIVDFKTSTKRNKEASAALQQASTSLTNITYTFIKKMQKILVIGIFIKVIIFW